MKLYTYQIAQWRRLKDSGIPLLDTTVKSGVIELAPKWEMVLDHKKGLITDAEYSKRYEEIFIHWWYESPLFFEELMKREVVAFGCYCKAGAFCHRHLAVKHMSNITDVVYLGEL